MKKERLTLRDRAAYAGASLVLFAVPFFAIPDARRAIAEARGKADAHSEDGCSIRDEAPIAWPGIDERMQRLIFSERDFIEVRLLEANACRTERKKRYPRGDALDAYDLLRERLGSAHH